MANSPFDKTQGVGDQYATLSNDVDNIGKLRNLIPGFEIIAELGRGAFGVVYLARDEQLDRKVAIKVPLFDDPGRREQYVKEAQHAARLDIAGIVPVYQVGTLASGEPFVVQKFIDGNTLRKEMKESGKLSLHRACSLMAQIARVVAQAHEKELIHRDLKPDNILIDAEGTPWVADFGLAIFEKDQNEHRGERAGTPIYMAPEQFRGRAEWLDGRSDIYSMGVMLYELLVGRAPFEAQTLAELEEQVLHRDPKPISQRAPHIPVELDFVFQNCCAKQVSDRYANAFELVADLEAILPDIPEDAPRSSQRGPMHSSAGMSRRLSKQQMGKSTRRISAGLTVREELPVKKSSRFVIPVSVLTIAILSSAAVSWLPKLLPSSTSASAAGDVKLSPVDDQTPPSVAAVDQPTRPLRVASSGGTHSTIAAALAIAEEGETILIRPGIYNENLSISRSVKLVGEGKRENIIINGENASAITVRNQTQVELANLTLEGNASSPQQFNTLHVYGGTVELSDCRIVAYSWDCIRAEKGCELKARKCRFESKAEPAIYATGVRNLDIVECDFDIRPLSLTDRALGVQAVDSQGKIRDSVFRGAAGAIGIQWKSTKGTATVENCTIEDCEIGALVQDCADVIITGESAVANGIASGDSAAAKKTKIKGCTWGIRIMNSFVDLANIDIAAVSKEAGIQIINSAPDVSTQPKVQISDCKISGYNTALTGERANVVMRTSLIDSSDLGVALESMSTALFTECRFFDSINKKARKSEERNSTGIRADNSSASFDRCTIEWLYTGVDVQGKSDLTFVDSQFIENLAGLIVSAAIGQNVVAGDIRVKGGVFDSNVHSTIAVAIGTEQDRRRLPLDFIRFHFEGTAFKDSRASSFYFCLPCTLQLADCTFEGAKDKPIPTLKEGLQLRPDGTSTKIEWRNP